MSEVIRCRECGGIVEDDRPGLCDDCKEIHRQMELDEEFPNGDRELGDDNIPRGFWEAMDRK